MLDLFIVIFFVSLAALTVALRRKDGRVRRDKKDVPTSVSVALDWKRESSNLALIKKSQSPMIGVSHYLVTSRLVEEYQRTFRDNAALESIESYVVKLQKTLSESKHGEEKVLPPIQVSSKRRGEALH